MRGTLYVGCSGFSYAEWKPEFYPADLKTKDMLRAYAERLPSVEINNTFYRSPTEKTVAGWAEQTPEAFRFALKAPQRITHIMRLRDVDEPLEYFLRAVRTLGGRLGPLLFQLPPSFRYDADVLDAFLARLPGGGVFSFAMEFRHPSWDDDGPRRKLAEHGIAWCVADTDERDATVVRTSERFAYFRLRKNVYDDHQLQAWSKEIAALLEEGRDAFVYFKHEDEPTAPRYALRMRELAG